MTLRTRLVLLVTLTASAGIVAVAAVMLFFAWRTILHQAEEQGALVARLFARSANAAEQVSARVEDVIADEMTAQALIAAHLADLAETAGTDADGLSARLMEITARSAIDEIWITDETGGLYGRSVPDFGRLRDATPGPLLGEDFVERLLDGTRFSAVSGRVRRDFDDEPFKYVGVRGVDRPRVVLVGRELRDLADLRRDIGVQHTMEALLRDGSIEGIWIFDDAGDEVAQGTAAETAAEPTEEELGAVAEVLRSGQPATFLHGDWLTVAAPMPDPLGIPMGVTLARLPTDRLRGLIGDYLTGGISAALAVLLIGGGVSLVSARRLAAPVALIAAAAGQVDARSFTPSSLAGVARRPDELGHLARVFQRMAKEVFAREEQLEGLVKARTRELEDRNRQLQDAKQAMDADLEIAKSLQSAILPRRFPPSPAYDGTATMTPAQQMGGDFYDFFAIDESRVGIVIADVSGKGVAAGFFMAVSRTILQTAARDCATPARCLEVSNRLLCAQNPLELFVTVFYGILDLRTGTLCYANGGHNPPYLVDRQGGIAALRSTGGIAMGVIDDMPYKQDSVTLQPGDTLFLYTDGVSEAMNAAGEEFTETRLEAALAGAHGRPVAGLLETVTAAVRTFTGDAPQSDDITCLVVRYTGDGVEGAPDAR